MQVQKWHQWNSKATKKISCSVPKAKCYTLLTVRRPFPIGLRENVHRISESWNHRILRIIEYSRLDGTHKDHQVDSWLHTGLKIRPYAWEHCPDTPWTLAAQCYDQSFSGGNRFHLSEDTRENSILLKKLRNRHCSLVCVLCHIFWVTAHVPVVCVAGKTGGGSWHLVSFAPFMSKWFQNKSFGGGNVNKKWELKEISPDDQTL